MREKTEFQPTDETHETASKTETIRRKALRAAAIGSMAVFGVTNLQGDTELPKDKLLQHNEETAYDEDTLTVMTANVHYWTGAYEVGHNFSDVMQAVNETEADVICMQEFVDDGYKIENIHEAGFNIYFAETADWPLRDPIGNAIISKLPFKNTETISLPNPDTITPRNAIIGEITTANGNLKITNTHLSNDQEEKIIQSKVLYPHVENIDILCGDLKQLPEELLASPLGNLINPAYLETSSPTFPSKPNKPAVREVDYVTSTCGEPVPDTLQIVDINSDHFARVQEINTTGCTEHEQTMATDSDEKLVEPVSE